MFPYRPPFAKSGFEISTGGWESIPPPRFHSSSSLEAYVLGMVGLTVAFNDAPDITPEMVKEKFDLAIALAKSLGI